MIDLLHKLKRTGVTRERLDYIRAEMAKPGEYVAVSKAEMREIIKSDVPSGKCPRCGK